MNMLCSSTAVTSSKVHHSMKIVEKPKGTPVLEGKANFVSLVHPFQRLIMKSTDSVDKQNGVTHFNVSSTRYLLTHIPFFNQITPRKTTLQNQVVVLRVPLHCKACKRKVRNYISKMEGQSTYPS
ncbi:hypothetical protein VNO78_14217 [Psophocarpus tetragonolobus]|uniref:Uncharacterized protein n=1 Tax=Psophocarpus tetragonolobus TaxID=3891 RepID=A0AAN9SR64_PSOTE